MVNRICQLSNSNSFFLFGSRGTGKTSLLKHQFSADNAYYIDLLDPNTFETFFRNPSELSNICRAKSFQKPWVILDEVQKIPALLDVVHQLIESTALKFILTGSSSRKLKRGGGNLLAGRAFIFELYPFTARELGDQFQLDQVLQWGALPKVHSLQISDVDRELYLKAYTQTYLKEEIQEEQIVRNLRSFYQFLEIAAQMNGKLVNYSKFAQDVGVDTKTIQSYFEILEETHIGLRLNAYHASLRKRQRANPKFYYFDIGVQRSLLRVAKYPVTKGTFEYGNCFEHFLILEFHRLNSYLRADFEFSYLQTHHNLEVDLVIDRPRKPTVLVEIKSSHHITVQDLSSLVSIKKDYPNLEYFCLSLDNSEKELDGIICLPWQKGLETLMPSISK